MSWYDWRPLRDQPDYGGPAVYELRIATDDRPIAIPRFLGTDVRGVLSIGETGGMAFRHRQFISAIEKCYGHSEVNLLYYLLRYTPLNKLHPKHCLEYRFRKERAKQAAKLAEARLIKAYVRQFGEAPPLNSAIPDRYGDWA
jgi:hypothetical protein